MEYICYNCNTRFCIQEIKGDETAKIVGYKDKTPFCPRCANMMQYKGVGEMEEEQKTCEGVMGNFLIFADLVDLRERRLITLTVEDNPQWLAIWDLDLSRWVVYIFPFIVSRILELFGEFIEDCNA